MNKAYVQSMSDHIQHLLSQLEELSDKNTPLNNFESLAAERLLQVLIEACIGIAKHWYKAKKLGAPQDAYRTFVSLAQSGELVEQTINWRKIIGMRNALVHDYLNIDPDIILDVIKQKRFRELGAFAKLGLSKLEDAD